MTIIELNEIRQAIFEDYLETNNIFNGKQYAKDVKNDVLIDCILPYHNDLMKEHAMQHIQEFIISTIIEKQPKEYTVDSWLPSKLWDTWDDFIKYLNTIKKDNPIINEYLEFVEKRKEKNFTELIDFTFKQIKLEQ